MNRAVICIIAVSLAVFGRSSGAAPQEISPAANHVAEVIDAMEVEKHWPAGVHVSWESGVPDGRPENAEGKHTHCSAFVAAAAKKFGIYVLRPPEHAQVLLADAQYDWFAEQGEKYGWWPVSGALDAQNRANQGDLVVAAYRNQNDDRPGHIAIVRPSTKSEAAVEEEGPQITQAGETNFRTTTLKRGFAGHPAAWGKHEVRFYAHTVTELSGANVSR